MFYRSISVQGFKKTRLHVFHGWAKIIGQLVHYVHMMTKFQTMKRNVSFILFCFFHIAKGLMFRPKLALTL